MRSVRAVALSLLLPVLPAIAGDFPCPAGWENPSDGCDPAVCLAPMGKAVIQVEAHPSVDGVALADAMAGYEKVVGADGTPLHDLIAETTPDIAGQTGLRRDYTGTARARDLRIALVLLREDGQDILLRAVWDADGGLIFQHLIDAAIREWKPF